MGPPHEDWLEAIRPLFQKCFDERADFIVIVSKDGELGFYSNETDKACVQENLRVALETFGGQEEFHERYFPNAN